MTAIQERLLKSMSGEESRETQGERRRNGQNVSGQGQTGNHEQQYTAEAPSRSTGEEGDYFQGPRQSETSDSTRGTEKLSGGSSDKPKRRPAMSNRPSTSASYTLGRMHEDPKTSDKMSRVFDQLDEEGMENLEHLVTEFAKQRAKPKGQLTSMDYRDQNPWYDQGRSKPNFSLGEPLPHVGEENNGRTPGRDQVCVSILPSSGSHSSRIYFHIAPVPPARLYGRCVF